MNAVLGVGWAGLAAGCDAREGDRDPAASAVVAIEPDVTIGVVEGEEAYLFGAIVSIAVDEAGRVYVGDRIGATIRAYDGSGGYLKTVAREGEGPGEIYGWPADVTFAPNGRLYVRDGSRVTILGPREPGGVADSVVAVWPLAGYGNLSSTRSRVDSAGTYLYPNYIFRQGEPPRFFFEPIRAGQPTGDTLTVPPYRSLAGRRRAFVRLGERDGRLLDGFSHVPFAALPSWDVTANGTLLSTDGARYALVETDIVGDTLRSIAGPTSAAITIPAAEREDSARALAARLDSLPVPLDRVVGLGEGVAERRLPETLPSIVGIHVAMDGRIWVERWPSEGQGAARFYDVYDADGRFERQIVLRAPLLRDPPPYFGARYVAGVLRDPDTGVERVVRFTVPSLPN